MFDLNRFSLSDMTRCGMELRRLGEHASGMEEVGERVVRYLYEHLRTPDERRARPDRGLRSERRRLSAQTGHVLELLRGDDDPQQVLGARGAAVIAR